MDEKLQKWAEKWHSDTSDEVKKAMFEAAIVAGRLNLTNEGSNNLKGTVAISKKLKRRPSSS